MAERRYWTYALLTLVCIVLSLFLGPPLLDLLGDQNVRAILFLGGMLFIGSAILVHGLTLRFSVQRLLLILAITGLFVMTFLRLGMAERSHVLEYCLLTLFVHRALLERKKRFSRLKPGLYTAAICLSVGILDELVQIWLPKRHFDPYDIIFNSLAVLTVLGAYYLLAAFWRFQDS